MVYLYRTGVSNIYIVWPSGWPPVLVKFNCNITVPTHLCMCLKLLSLYNWRMTYEPQVQNIYNWPFKKVCWPLIIVEYYETVKMNKSAHIYWLNFFSIFQLELTCSILISFNRHLCYWLNFENNWECKNVAKNTQYKFKTCQPTTIVLSDP